MSCQNSPPSRKFRNSLQKEVIASVHSLEESRISGFGISVKWGVSRPGIYVKPLWHARPADPHIWGAQCQRCLTHLFVKMALFAPNGLLVTRILLLPETMKMALSASYYVKVLSGYFIARQNTHFGVYRSQCFPAVSPCENPKNNCSYPEEPLPMKTFAGQETKTRC
jgi:hypothetical protein